MKKKKTLPFRTVPRPLLEDRRPFPDVAPGHHPGPAREPGDDVGHQVAVEVGGDLECFSVVTRERERESFCSRRGREKEKW